MSYENGIIEPSFFRRSADDVASDLLGQRVETYKSEGYITKVRAFDDVDASQSHKESVLNDPGELFMMQYRDHHFANISTREPESCVEIRGLYTDEHIDGPGKVSDELGLGAEHDTESIGDTANLLYHQMTQPYSVGVERSDIPTHQGAVAEYILSGVDW